VTTKGLHYSNQVHFRLINLSEYRLSSSHRTDEILLP